MVENIISNAGNKTSTNGICTTSPLAQAIAENPGNVALAK
jgi:hypothetical protein